MIESLRTSFHRRRIHSLSLDQSSRCGSVLDGNTNFLLPSNIIHVSHERLVQPFCLPLDCPRISLGFASEVAGRHETLNSACATLVITLRQFQGRTKSMRLSDSPQSSPWLPRPGLPRVNG